MSRQIKFCVRVHQGGYDYETLRRIFRDADRLGYHSASLYDLINIPTLECWTTLAALASETHSLRLIPMVLANLYRQPALLAKMAATLDVISGGRLELGIGAGGGRGDHLAAGYPFPGTPARVALLEESVEIIKRLWAGARVDFQGSHYFVEGACCDPVPLQKPHPPLLIGGHGERYLLRAAAKHADICNIGSEMALEEHRAKLGVLAKHCQDVGRDFQEIEVSHNTRVIIAENQKHLAALLHDIASSMGVPVDEYRESLVNAVMGTPEQCIQRIQTYVAAGISYFFLIFPDPAPTEQLELFASQVMPAFITADG